MRGAIQRPLAYAFLAHRPSQATCTRLVVQGFSPYKRGVAGSKPAAPTNPPPPGHIQWRESVWRTPSRRDSTLARDRRSCIIGDVQRSLNASAKTLATGEIRIEPDGAYVYEAYDPTEAPLYVGLANDLNSRLAWHRSYSPWYASAARIVWTLYETRNAAGRAEVERIRALRPRHNSQHNPDPTPTPELPADGDWIALGKAMRDARQAAGRTQRSIARDADLDPTTLRLLEAGSGPACDSDTLIRLDYALGWTPGSAMGVLRGGTPLPLTRAERQRRALAAADEINLMAGV